MLSSISKILGTAAATALAISLTTLPTTAEASPYRDTSRLRQSPAQALLQRETIRLNPDLRLPTYDYQVFAPSAPTSGPQGIWAYGSCNNTIRVLVSNISDVAGGGVDVSLRVTHTEEIPTYIDSIEQVSTITRIEEDFSDSRRLRSIPANDHQWVEFTNVSFPDVDHYILTASISTVSINSTGQDGNAQNNSRTLNTFVNHSCN